jgi:hypothetical protein
MGNLHDHRHAIQQSHVLATVELVGLLWAQSSGGCKPRRRIARVLAPSPGVTPYCIVTPANSASTLLFEDPHLRQLFTSGFGHVRRQKPFKFRRPSARFGRCRTNRSYSNEVSSDFSTLQSVFRNTYRSRAIKIVLPSMKCSCSIRAIGSTISIPHHLLHSKAGSAKR